MVVLCFEQARVQRTLTQKMIANYAMCVANINYNSSLASLRETVRAFDKVHNGLIDGSQELYLPPATNPEVRSPLSEALCCILWGDLQCAF